MIEDSTPQPEVPQYVHPTGQTFADKDQAKPLLKMLRKLMQPRHLKTKRFVKTKVRKMKRQNYY